MDADWLKSHVRDIPDYPKPGIIFRDITPLLAAPDAFSATVDALGAPFADEHIDKVCGIEARGFVFAAPVAYHHAAGFVPVRKPGKLPWDIEREEYELEYGSDLLEIHRDAVARLVEKLGGEVVGFTFLIELAFLGGRSKIDGYRVESLVTYE
jgi:adenine phosphoribosyltransferase